MHMSMHAGCRRHDAEHADDEYDSDSEGNLDQGVAQAQRRRLGSFQCHRKVVAADLLIPARQTIPANSVIFKSNNRP